MKRALFLLLLVACTKRPAAEEGALGPPVPDSVQRVVTLAPSLTEIVQALGAGDRIIGVTRYDDAPGVEKLPKVGGYNDPSVETIVRLAPDAVLCQPAPGNKGAVNAVGDAGIPVRFFRLESLEDVRRAVLEIGSLLKLETEAKAVVARMEGGRERARVAAKNRARKPRVVLLVGIEPLVAAGPGSFTAELLEDAGAENIVQRSAQPWPQLSQERLLSQNPDAVLLVGVEHGADPSRLPVQLRHRLVMLKETGLLRPGPGAIEALDELTRVFDGLVTK